MGEKKRVIIAEAFRESELPSARKGTLINREHHKRQRMRIMAYTSLNLRMVPFREYISVAFVAITSII